MSRFKEIVLNCLLEAKQVGILYHTTSSSGLASILKSNKIWTNWIQGVSFTRDKNYWYGDYPAQLVLDGDKLSENHKVYPFNYPYACNIKDDIYIQRKLDELLDVLLFYENDDTLLVFRKLCKYYFSINPQATVRYINFYKEQNDPEGVKFGKKQIE